MSDKKSNSQLPTNNAIYDSKDFNFKTILNKLKKEAIKLKKYGIICVPLKKGTKRPSIRWERIKKTPLYQFKKGMVGMGVVTGEKSNVTVIDIDNTIIWNKIVTLFDGKGEIERLPEVRTPSGGLHYYAKYDKDILQNQGVKFIVDEKNNNVDSGLDIRNDGGQVVAPPSLYCTDKDDKKKYRGLPYGWERDLGDCDLSIDGKTLILPDVPSWLKNLVTGKTQLLLNEDGDLSINQEKKVESNSANSTSSTSTNSLNNSSNILTINDPMLNTFNNLYTNDSVFEHHKKITLKQMGLIINSLDKTKYGNYTDWLNLIFGVSRWADENDEDDEKVLDILDDFSSECDGYVDRNDVEKNYLGARKSYNKKNPVTIGTILHSMDKLLLRNILNSKTDTVIDENELNYFIGHKHVYYSESFNMIDNPEVTIADVDHYLLNTTCLIRTRGRDVYATKTQSEYTFECERENNSTWEFSIKEIFTDKKRDEGYIKMIKNINYDPDKTESRRNSKLSPLTIGDRLTKLIRTRGLYKKYSNITFKPYLSLDSSAPGQLNLFTGFPWKLTGDYDQNRIDIIRDHFINVFANGVVDHAEYIIKLEAYKIQHPATKCRIALVFQSRLQQSGFKTSFWVNFMRHVIGEQRLLEFNKISNLTKDFNKSREGKLSIVLEETENMGGHKLSDYIKSIITGTKINVEPKGLESYTVNDYSNLIFLTQHDMPVKVEHGDCRYAIFRCSDKKKNDSAYFTKLAKALGIGRNGELLDYKAPQDWFNYLATYDISDFNPQNIPETKIREDIKESCVEPIIQYFIECLHNPDNSDNVFLSHAEFIESYPKETMRKLTFNNKIRSLPFDTELKYQSQSFKSVKKRGFKFNKKEGVKVIRKYLNNKTWNINNEDEVVDSDLDIEIEE